MGPVLRAQLSRAQLSRAQLSGAQLSGAQLSCHRFKLLYIHTLDVDAYAAIFGNTSAEYWLGLEAMHALTSDKHLGRKKVRFELSNQVGTYFWIEYLDFRVNDRGDWYRLSVGNKAGGNAPDFSFR